MEMQKILQVLEDIAPRELAEDWDNPGLLIGSPYRDVKKILICLDVDNRIIDFACENKIDLIISHHPIIFNAIKHIRFDLPLGKRIEKLIRNEIMIFSAHTNLDAAHGGVNDVLAERLELTRTEPFAEHLGRIGFVEKISVKDFADRVKKNLNADHIRLITADENRKISKIAVVSGAGAEFIDEAAELNAEMFVTSDVRYHQAQHAFELGLNLIDAGHFYTEFPIVHALSERLKNIFSQEIFNRSVEIIEDTDGKDFFRAV